MPQLINKDISKYLSNLIRNTNIVTLDQFEPEDLIVQLRKHFENFGDEQFVEYERNNNWLNNFLNKWNVSNRTPMEFSDVSQISSNGIIYLYFSTNHPEGGFKYLQGPLEFAFLNEGFYLGFGHETKKNGVNIYYQNLYVPKRKIESLDSKL